MLAGSALPSAKPVSVGQEYALALKFPLTFNPPSCPKAANVPRLVDRTNLESSFIASPPPSVVSFGSKFILYAHV